MTEIALALLGPGEHEKLPRGRHGLPRDLVISHQRERMLSATSALIAEHGYAALKVADVTASARVSRATFYKLFRDKREAVLAAQPRALEMLERSLVSACESRSDWPAGVALAVRTGLEFCRRSPAEARLLLSSGSIHFEPHLAPKGSTLRPSLVRLLSQGASSYPVARVPDSLHVEAAVGAVLAIVDSWFAAGGIASRSELAFDLTEIVLAPYLGAEEAKRIALAA